MFTISNSTDYALLLLSYLYNKKKATPISKIAHDTGLPLRYISRIASILVHEDILISKEGKMGGYVLKKSLSKISLYKLLSVFEGPLSITKCFKDSNACKYATNICSHKNKFQKTLQETLKKSIKKLTLRDVL